MKGLRNRLIHGYFNIDLDIVWDTVRSDLPQLIPCSSEHCMRSRGKPREIRLLETPHAPQVEQRRWELRTGRLEASRYVEALRSVLAHLDHSDTLAWRRAALTPLSSRLPTTRPPRRACDATSWPSPPCGTGDVGTSGPFVGPSLPRRRGGRPARRPRLSRAARGPRRRRVGCSAADAVALGASRIRAGGSLP